MEFMIRRKKREKGSVCPMWYVDDTVRNKHFDICPLLGIS